MSEDKIQNFVLQSMFKGGFSQVGFASFLVARPYIFDVLLINLGLRGVFRIINPYFTHLDINSFIFVLFS